MKILGKDFEMLLKIALIYSLSFVLFLHAEDKYSYKSIQPKSKNIDISADFLYWYTSETVDWAFTLAFDENTIKTAYKTLSFNWAPGFRVGLGYNSFCDHWNTKANYTQFHSKAVDSTRGSVTPAFLAARLSLLEPFSSGKAQLSLHYNMLDWDLGQSFSVCKCLCLRPAIGLKGGWITQTLKTSWTIDDLFGLHTASENLKQKFSCVGPTAGFSMKWYLKNIQKHSFSLIGQFEADYLWGHWSIQDKFTDDLFFTKIEIKTLDRNFGSIVLCSFFGFEWNYSFSCNQSCFATKIGYEIEDWFNQFQIFSDASGSQNNNLILQGLCASLNFTF